MYAATNHLEKFVEHGKNGEVIPEEWTFEQIDEKYPYILEIVKVSWQYNNFVIEKDINEDCDSVVVLPDRSGVLVLQSSIKYGPDNALILNADGDVRYRLKNPFKDNPYCTSHSEYSFGGYKIENHKLGLIVGVCTKQESGAQICGDWLYELDADTGSFISYRPMGR